jgi:hypothetical protein
MAGSVGKRARALVAFGAGLLPIAGAQAQTVPTCEFKLAISKSANISGNLFTKDSDPTVYGWFQIQVGATKVKPNNKQLLVPPTAMVSAAYYYANGALSSYALELRSPFTHKGEGSGPTHQGALNVEGTVENFSLPVFTFVHWKTLVDVNAADKFGALRKDVTLTLGPADNDTAGKSYTFTFPKGDFGKGYKSAKPQFDLLYKKAAAGECKPQHQVTNTSSGSGATGCFLTTATCEAVGLADDCWELRTLRKFRDGWLAAQSGGMDDIRAYYAQAPQIAERLRADRQALLRLYWTRIVPSALAAQVGANRLARAIYTNGMRSLAATYRS